jgi:hypothetical protein
MDIMKSMNPLSAEMNWANPLNPRGIQPILADKIKALPDILPKKREERDYRSSA